MPARGALFITQALVLSVAAAIVSALVLRIRRKLLQPREPLLVMSFGSVCLTARSLGVAGARRFAAPFDWIFSNPAIVAHVISSGGETLLDGSQYFKANGGNNGTTGTCHRTYSGMLAAGQNKQNRHAIIFNHHDPSHPEDKAYFERTVDRLQAALASPLPKLCVVCSLEQRSRLNDADLDRLLDSLAQHSNPAGHVTLVAVKLTTGCGTSEGAGLKHASHRERRLRHTTLRVVELRCRAGLGPKALWLADEDDRLDLLHAIFGAEATFDASGMLTSPVLADDPLLHPHPQSANADVISRASGGTEGGHRRHGTMYSEDGYLIAQPNRAARKRIEARRVARGAAAGRH